MASPLDMAATRDRNRTGWAGLAWFALAVVILVAFRLHAFDLPLETDECNYAYIGKRLLSGDRLYVDVWDHQPHGVFVLFAGVIAMFGDTPEVFRWMAMAFSLVSLGFVFGIARRVAGPLAGVAAALFFAVASSDPGTAGEGCNREIYMNAFILAAWYLTIIACAGTANVGGDMRSPSRYRRNLLLLVAGGALGLASLLKTIVVIHWILLAVWVAWVSGAMAVAMASLCWLAVGPALLWGGSFAYFAATSRWDAFIDAVFAFNLSYSDSSEHPLFRVIRFFAPIRHPSIFESSLPLWLAAGAGWIGLLVFGLFRRDRGAVAVVSLGLAGFIAVCLPGRFWPHYYYLLVAPAAVAAAAAIALLADALARTRKWTIIVRRDVTAGVCGAVFVALLGTQFRDYLSQPPFGITVKRYNSRDFWGRGHGENVRRVTDPKDEIFVYGNDASIYYYARRKSASRYTMITGLQPGFEGFERRREILLDELEASPPRLIVVLLGEDAFDGWRAFLARHYGPAVGVDYNDLTGELIMAVFVRRDRPIEAIDWDWDRASVGGWGRGGKPPAP